MINFYALAKALKIDMESPKVKSSIKELRKNGYGLNQARDRILFNLILDRIAELVEKVESNESRNIKTSN